MKKVPCACKTCCNRRSHHESDGDGRPQQTVEVPDNFIGKAYCSIECMLYDEHDEGEVKKQRSHNPEV
jgi:hypothetical protein